MTIAHPTDTSRRTGTTAISPAVTYISPLAVGDLYLWWVGSRYDPALPVLDSGITNLIQRTGGPSTPGSGTGQVTLTIAQRLVASTAEGGTDHNVTLTGGNVVAAQASQFTKASGNTWSIAATSAVKNTESTSWSVSADAALDFQVGDWLVGYILANDSAADFPAVRQFLAAGITFTGNNTQTLVGQVAIGDGFYLVQVCAQVTAGAATVAPSLNATSSVAAGGVVGFVRLREVAAGGTAPSFSTQPTSQTVTAGGAATFTYAVAGTGTLSVQAQRSTDGGTTWANVSGATTTTYVTPATTVTGGAANNGDKYRFIASGDTAPTATSSTVTLTVNAAGDTTPPSDTGGVLTESSVAQTGFTITGPAATDNVAVTGYDYSLDGGTTWTVTNWAAPTYNFSGLTPGTTYQVRRRARDAAGNFSTPLLAKSVTTLAAGATITSSPLKDNTGTLHLSAPVEAYISNPTTGALVAKVTGLTSNASTGVVSTGTVTALVASTAYRVVWRRTDTGAEGLETLNAA